MDDFLNSGGGDLISSLVNTGAEVYTTQAELNANPLNTALVTRGVATTPAGSTSGLGTNVSSSSLLVVALIVGLIAFFALSR